MEEEERQGEKKGARAAGGREREGPDRRRHIRELLLSLVLGGLDSAVPSREGKKGRNEDYGKMRGETKRRRGAMEQRGWKWEAQEEPKKKRIIEKKRGEGNRTRRWNGERLGLMLGPCGGGERTSVVFVFLSLFSRICVLYQTCELGRSHVVRSLVHTSRR